jgi:HK97 family phage major capsid protein
MSENVKIKQLYEEAAGLHKQAKDILAEFEGKEMPQEKQAEVDGLLDQVEAKTESAKGLEAQDKRAARAVEQDKFLNDPVTRKSFFTPTAAGGSGAAVKVDGRDLTAEELAEMDAIAPFKAFHGPTNAEYGSAMRKYLRKGVQGMNNDEIKTLSVGDPSAGGYLQQDTYIATLLAKQREAMAMRQICTVLPPVPSGSAIAPAEDSFLSDAEWTTEVATGSDDAVKPFGQRKLTPHPLAKRLKVSNTLLRNPFFDVEAWVRDRLAYKFSVPEENGLINGSGSQQPLGLLNTASLPTFSTATANALHGDDIINWVYSLPQSYASRPSTRILSNRSFIRKVRTLASKNAATAFTNYIWQPGLAAGQPNAILDIPYALSDKFPTGLDGSDVFENNALVAVVGDFSFFWIVDALQMSIQRLVELYAEANQTGFIGRKETDGMAVMAEAFYALKIKSA